MTKICDFPYPIYDLTKNVITYLWQGMAVSVYSVNFSSKTPGARPVTRARDKPLQHVHSCCKHKFLVASLKKKKKKKQNAKVVTLFMTTMAPKWLKSIPYLWPNRLKNHTHWGRTYLYSPYKGVPLPVNKPSLRSLSRVTISLFFFKTSTVLADLVNSVLRFLINQGLNSNTFLPLIDSLLTYLYAIMLDQAGRAVSRTCLNTLNFLK